MISSLKILKVFTALEMMVLPVIVTPVPAVFKMRVVFLNFPNNSVCSFQLVGLAPYYMLLLVCRQVEVHGRRLKMNIKEARAVLLFYDC